MLNVFSHSWPSGRELFNPLRFYVCGLSRFMFSMGRTFDSKNSPSSVCWSVDQGTTPHHKEYMMKGYIE